MTGILFGKWSECAISPESLSIFLIALPPFPPPLPPSPLSLAHLTRALPNIQKSDEKQCVVPIG